MTRDGVPHPPHGCTPTGARGNAAAPGVIGFYERVGLVSGRRLANGYRDFPPEAVPWLHYVRTAQTLGFSLAEIARHGEELREAPDSAAALSVLFEQKIQVIDARMAELATLRAELATRVDTGCPLRAVGRPS
ncbi:MerR family DNA-binding protein [Streptomyces sp. NBC_01483]|uniref:MerR family DNA-binding protein n=1 Tax=Streptomyces sp. NBC_01483 TaxID=2903883 RepID=UPI002E3239D2|nr:MerR family DNA-binding protein [Streptomyces sp. NBC_01483]